MKCNSPDSVLVSVLEKTTLERAVHSWLTACTKDRTVMAGGAMILLCSVVLLFVTSETAGVKRSDDSNPLTAVVEKLVNDVTNLQAQMESQKNEFNHELEFQRQKIAALKAINNQTIAFSAYISDEPHVNAASGSAAPFRGVITNVGGGYSPVTSAFTAPISGQYFFIVHADCSTDFRSLRVTLNGRAVFNADNDNKDGHVTGASLLRLNVGDVVTTKYYSTAGVLDAGRESTFSGFLVK